LTSIVKTIILCGRQEILLKGKIEFGNVLNCDNKNDGTFRSLLRFRVDAGDTVLEYHFINDNNRLQYISPSIQNEFIEICSKIIKKKNVDNVNNSKYFAVLADETTEISNVEQMSLCLRYIDIINNVIREDFLEYIPVYDMTGRGLALTIITRLKEIGINLNYKIGQGYDGAASMNGHLNGAQTVICIQKPCMCIVALIP